MDVKKLMAEGSLDNLSEDLFKSVSSYSEEVKAFQRQKAAEYADQVVAALKKIEQDIKDRYDRVGLNLEKRVLNIKDGKDGINGRDGRDGKDGKPGAAGLPGRDGKDGKNGRDGVDGKDGVSVVNAFLDFDNSLVIELSNGRQVNAGAILGADFAEKVKIIANGGGTSQGVIDTLASLQAQISAISSLGAVSYQGTWNASTNTPTITASVGTKGYYYVVSVAGTTSINGESKWGVGDWIVFNGSTWQKVDGGSTGNLTTLDVSGAAAIGGSLTLSGGSANSITYLNGSKVLSTDGNLAFDGTSFSTGGSIYFSSNVGYYLYAGGNAGAQLKVLGYGSEGVAFKNYVGTTEYMRLDSTGLGIGTSSVNNKLQIQGNIGLNNSSGTQVALIAPSLGGSFRIQGQTTEPITLWTNNTLQATLDSSGNLGIGTSSPGQKLEVAGAITSSGNLTAHQTSKAVIAFNSGNAEIRSYGAVGTVGRINFLQGSGGSAPTIAMSLDASGNLGLGVTPSAWGSSFKAFELANGVAVASNTAAGDANLLANAYSDAGGYKYKLSGVATSRYQQYAGAHNWFTAASGTAGNAISFTQAMTLNASGNLGIGTSSPGTKLDVATSSGDCVIRLGNGTSQARFALDSDGPYIYPLTSGDLSLRIFTSSGSQAFTLDASGNLGLGVTPSAWGSTWRSLEGSFGQAWYYSNTATNTGLVSNTFHNGTNWIYKTTNAALRYELGLGAGDHRWYIAPSGTAGNAISFTQAMTLDASGNLGIGTSSPAAKLVSAGSSATNFRALILRNGDGTTGSSASIDFEASSGTQGSEATMAGRIAGVRTGSGTTGALTFSTTNSGVLGERARIDSSGNLLVGYTASNGSYLLQVNSQIYATNATIATSDGRYKESVQPLQNALSLISTLNPVSFKWKHHDVHNFAVGETDVGFIAQEVKQSLENTAYVNQVVKANTCTLTDGTEEEFLGIAEGKMIPLLVKAIQELKAEVDSLKAQLNK